MGDVLFVAVPTLIMVGMIVGLMAFNRLLRHRELITLAERGLVPPPRRRKPGRLNSGLMLTAIGAALCVGMHPLSVDEFPQAALGMSPIMLVGLLPLFIGIAQLLSWQLARTEEPVPSPAAWAQQPEPSSAALDYELLEPGHEMPDVPAWLESQGESAAPRGTPAADTGHTAVPQERPDGA